MNELVSIIMPSYNTAQFISETINSVLKQTYQNWELIIVDDCSSDNTDEVVATYSDTRIRYLKNDRNNGAAFSRNRALQEAKGRWIAFLDSDDVWMPEKLQKQLVFMKEKHCYFSYTKYSEIDEESKELNRIISGPKKITKNMMYSYCWPGCLTVMYDTEKIGLIQIENIKKNNDYAMWLRVSKKADCFFLDENLARYRKRTGSISNHNYSELVKWHYRLFKDVEHMGSFRSCIYTGRNLLCGLYKKLFMVKRG